MTTQLDFDTADGREQAARRILFEILEELSPWQKAYSAVPERVREEHLCDVRKRIDRHCGDMMGVLLGESRIVGPEGPHETDF